MVYKKRKFKGYIVVDSYAIPIKKVREYKQQREYWAKELLQFFKQHFPKVDRLFKGSQDGEAIVGLSESDRILRLIHLDPQTIAELESARKKGTVLEYMSEIIE